MPREYTFCTFGSATGPHCADARAEHITVPKDSFILRAGLNPPKLYPPEPCTPGHSSEVADEWPNGPVGNADSLWIVPSVTDDVPIPSVPSSLALMSSDSELPETFITTDCTCSPDTVRRETSRFLWCLDSVPATRVHDPVRYGRPPPKRIFCSRLLTHFKRSRMHMSLKVVPRAYTLCSFATAESTDSTEVKARHITVPKIMLSVGSVPGTLYSPGHSSGPHEMSAEHDVLCIGCIKNALRYGSSISD